MLRKSQQFKGLTTGGSHILIENMSNACIFV